MSAVRSLTANDLLAIGESELGRSVEADEDRLKACVVEPMREDGGRDVYPGIPLKAAALCMAIVRTKPFERGSGRVALLATDVFLNLNGLDLADADDDLVALIAVVTSGDLTVLQVAALIETLSVPFRASS
jgi:death-on-curing protein